MAIVGSMAEESVARVCYGQRCMCVAERKALRDWREAIFLWVIESRHPFAFELAA